MLRERFKWFPYMQSALMQTLRTCGMDELAEEAQQRLNKQIGV